MAPVKRAATYELCRDKIVELIEARSDFAEIENLIRASGLPEEQDAALWLFAWSLRERGPSVGVEYPRPDARTRGDCGP